MAPFTRAARGAAPILSVTLLVASLGCAKARPDVVGQARCESWKKDIGPAFAARCSSCHGTTGGSLPAAGYDTSTYAGALGGGSDAVPNASAGDPSSRLLTMLDPATADATHLPVSDLFGPVQSWVVDCALSFVESSIHGRGILDPRSTDFHGQLIRDQKYDFSVCQKCHGSDFGGGTSGASCLGCHQEGPTACSTCHGDIAASASHGHHLGKGPLGSSFACGECHRVPAVYTDVGHIFLADGTLDPPPAEVVLGATAALTPAGSTRPAPPAFDPATQTCSNVYCHGAVLGDSAATNTAPVWSAPGTGQANCGTCHGLPPNHTGSQTCINCHPSVVDRDMKIIAPDKHIDGKVELGDPALGCTACHGSSMGNAAGAGNAVGNAAPPPDLTGATATTAPGVGAHQAHLTGAAHLRGPIACGECHLVPAEVSSPGHFGGHGPGGDDSPGAEVFPAGQPAGSVLAAAGGAAPVWTQATVTCSGVYCHGGGTALAADTTPGVERAPVWTASSGLTCGVACHGLPPTSSPHLPSMTRLDCVTCHPRTVDPTGAIIVSGPAGAETSLHINGVIDVAQ